MPPPLPKDEIEEGLAFLRWLPTGNFTFLGYREFDFSGGVIRQVEGSALGTLRNREPASERALADQSEQARAFLLEPRLLAFSKSGTRSQVHRPAYPDYIAVKRFDDAGTVIGEHGFLGLYTSPIYTERPERIPVVRLKVAHVKARSGLRLDGFDGKTLTQVLASYPRDELFQSTKTSCSPRRSPSRTSTSDGARACSCADHTGSSTRASCSAAETSTQQNPHPEAAEALGAGHPSTCCSANPYWCACTSPSGTAGVPQRRHRPQRRIIG
jgi:NAD-specific glutamate dehydrogenase